MNLQLAEELVQEWAEANAFSLGLNSANITVKYIWNPGGFVNQSYRLSDGKTNLHVKLVQEKRVPQLKQWAQISDHLTNEYNAPQLVGEVTQEITAGYCYGLVFDFINGKPLSSFSDPKPVVVKVLQALNQLHSDTEIKEAIVTEEKAYSYADAFIEEYITRFEEDMEIIRANKHLLHFVTESSLDWFDSEVEALKKIVSEMPSFQKQATDVVHNDINWENVLADDKLNFWMIDWDDLAVAGDAAMDYSVFLWPLYNSEDWPFWKEQVISLAGNEIFERIALYFRAKLLDDVIDVLADYVESENIAEVKEVTQKRAQDIHLRAYPEYLRLYA